MSQAKKTQLMKSATAAQKLEDFATHEHAWFDRAGRTAVYARLFGTGPAATNEGAALVNREFQSLLASLCHALDRYGEPIPTSSPAVIDAGLDEAASALLGNLGPRAGGSTMLAAQRLIAQLHAAIDILRDPDVQALVGAHSLQQTITNVLGSDAPDIQRLVDCGTAGQHVLEWLVTRLHGGAAGPPAPSDPVLVAAAQWLRASGADTGQQAQQRVAA